MPKLRKNIYTHEIELTNLKIKNRPREEFRQLLEGVKYRGYEVEQLADSRKIVITKPGGKFTFGRIKKEDFMVWIYNPKDSALWLISHKDIFTDIEEKGKVSSEAAVQIINALERVFNGEEPDEILESLQLNIPVGEPPEVLLKAYKWIWGQEDCNYPDGEGREMSMKGLRELKKKLRDYKG
jgi:hypothetical protein